MKRVVFHRPSGWRFEITPMLTRGWGYDPYVTNLIGRIRAGRPARDFMWDSNGLYLDRISDPHRVAMHGFAATKREISAAEMAEYKADEERRRLARENDPIWLKRREDQEEERKERERARRAYEKERDRVTEARRQHAEQWEASRPPKPGEWTRVPGGVYVTVTVEVYVNEPDRVLAGREEPYAEWVRKADVSKARYYQNTMLHQLTMTYETAAARHWCDPAWERKTLTLI